MRVKVCGADANDIQMKSISGEVITVAGQYHIRSIMYGDDSLEHFIYGYVQLPFAVLNALDSSTLIVYSWQRQRSLYTSMSNIIHTI